MRCCLAKVLAGVVFCYLSVGFYSCSKVVKDVHYDLAMQIGSVDIMIPPTEDTNTEHLLGTGIAHFNIDSFIKSNTQNVLGAGNIQSIHLTACTLTIPSQQSATIRNNFANLQSCYATFASSGSTQSYISRLDSNPDQAATTLSIPVNQNVDLIDYMKGSDFTYSIGGRLRRPITDSIKCTIQYQFSIGVQG